MAVQSPPQPALVGRLVFYGQELENEYPVHANAQFDLGRADVRNLLGVEDRCVSTHHIRFHCVVYEANDAQSVVAPMIWAQVLSFNGARFFRAGIDARNDGIVVHKEHGAFLLNPGDRLQLSAQIFIELRSVEGRKSNPPELDEVRTAEVSAFAETYRLTKRVLGWGAYAAVYVANEEKTGRQLACKIVLKQPVSFDSDQHLQLQFDTQDLELKQHSKKFAREFNILARLSHPNIISLEKVFSASFNVYIFQELITGGDLMSYLEKQGALNEPQAAMITRQLLEGVQYLHANNVVHRDIKPENILMTSWKEGARVVLTDFGQSRTIEDLEDAARKAGVFRMHSSAGTPGYVAPELIRTTRNLLQNDSGYSKAVDIWSIGCVAVTLLTNDYIFPDKRESSLHKISDSEYRACLQVLDTDPRWDGIGHRAKSFIKGCLETDENDRFTASQALAMPWFTHPQYITDFDGAYQRAIADWKPRQHNESLIEDIDTTTLVAKASRKSAAVQAVRSRHFAAPINPALYRIPVDEDLRPHHDKNNNAPPSSSRPSVRQISELRPGDEDEFGDDVFSQLSLDEYARGSPQKMKKKAGTTARSATDYYYNYDSLDSMVSAPPGWTQAYHGNSK